MRYQNGYLKTLGEFLGKARDSDPGDEV